MTSKFSNMVITFLSSVSLEALSLLCSHDIILTTGFPSDILVVPLQAHLQMLFSAWSPPSEPHYPHSRHLSHLASHPSHLGLNFTSQGNLSILHLPRLACTIKVHLLLLLFVYYLLNYQLSPPRGN